MTCDYCERPVHGRKMCQAHYKRWQRYGDPMHKRRHRGIMDAPVVPPLIPARARIMRTLYENPGVTFPWYALGSSKSGFEYSLRRLRKDYGQGIIETIPTKGYRMPARTAQVLARVMGRA